MKRILLASAVVVGMTLSAVSFATIGTVDMAKVFSNSGKAQAIRSQLESRFSAKRDALQSDARKVQAEAMKYEKNKSIMKKSERASIEKKLAKKENQLRQERMKMQQEMFAAQGEMTKKMFADVKTVIASIAKKKHLTMVMPNNTILFSSDESDITNAVLDDMK